MDGNQKEIKLSLKKITKKFKNGDGIENIDLEVHKGELVTLLGPSGCGKTTILRTIGGFCEPDSGEVILDGENIVKLPPEKRPTAMVFQSYNLWPHMTVFDNLSFGLRLRKRPKQEIKQEIGEMLKLVKMEGVEKKYPAQLSGGQQQRVAIARALLLKPSLLLLDEPFSALDAKIRLQMRDEIKRIQTDLGITIVFVTHDQEEAMSISHRIVVMSKGFFEQVGTPQEIYDNPQSLFVASFIGKMNFIDSDKEENKVIASRPEDIQLSDPVNSDFCGKIESMMVLGHFIELTVDTEKGKIQAYLSREQARGYLVGDNVGIRLGKKFIFQR